MLIETFQDSSSKAFQTNDYMLCLHLVCVLMIPLVAYHIKHHGNRLLLSLTNQLMLFVTFAMFRYINPYISQSIIGIYFSIGCNIGYPMLAYLLPKSLLASGLGLTKMFESIIVITS